MSEKLSRQQIYDRIRSSSKDSYILEEMQRLGFWESSGAPNLPETLIKREAALSQELNKLLEQDRRYNNQEAMLKEMRKARMKQAKENREQTRQKNKQKRLDKAARWQQAQQEQLLYLGAGISAGLNHTETDTERLQKAGLPDFASVTDLAASMGITLKDLRYLLYQRKVSRISHYHVFELQKKSGGKRRISAPKKRLKQLQHWVLDTLLNRIPVGDMVHGFVAERSIVTNALPHLQKDIVINVDLKDFFPSVSYARVKGLFRALGYSEQLSVVFALICTHAETEEVTMDGVRYYVQRGQRSLPQGSPASPAISNMIAYRLDKKIQGLAAKLGFTYTRYADDLSFSATKDHGQHIAQLLFFLKKIVESEGFTIHPEKTHIMRSGRRQKVTGIVVNQKPNIAREQLRKFRALLHHIECNGWQDQQWGKARYLVHSIEGYIHYVHMVNPEKGKVFRSQLERILARHGHPQVMHAPQVRPQQPEPEAVAPPPAEVQPPAPPIAKEPAPQNGWWDIFS